MELNPVILSRIQFAFVVSFHIIFPAFTIGLAAWLATIEGMRLATGNPVYRRVFDFWLKVFALSFGMGVVSGIVMAFQFGTAQGRTSLWHRSGHQCRALPHPGDEIRKCGCPFLSR
jgi:cytochrome bd ubiquinol oxidase subunit I